MSDPHKNKLTTTSRANKLTERERDRLRLFIQILILKGYRYFDVRQIINRELKPDKKKEENAPLQNFPDIQLHVKTIDSYYYQVLADLNKNLHRNAADNKARYLAMAEQLYIDSAKGTQPGDRAVAIKCLELLLTGGNKASDLVAVNIQNNNANQNNAPSPVSAADYLNYAYERDTKKYLEYKQQQKVIDEIAKESEDKKNED